MSWRAFLFSPAGRFNRSRYWGAILLQYAVLIVVWVPFIVLPDAYRDNHSTLMIGYIVLAIGVSIACLIAHVFAQVKRFHDRDKSWPWILIGFVPYIGGLWLLIELGMLPGTRGRNRYGFDPLGHNDDIVDIFGPPLRLEGAPPTQGPASQRTGAIEILPGA